MVIPIQDHDINNNSAGRAALQYVMKTLAPEPKNKRSKTLEVYDNGEFDSDGNNPIQIK